MTVDSYNNECAQFFCFFGKPCRRSGTQEIFRIKSKRDIFLPLLYPNRREECTMPKAIIVAKNQNSCDAIAAIITDNGFDSVTTVLSGLEVREKFACTDFDLLVIHLPLADEFGLELIENISETSTAAVLIIVKPDIADEVQKKVASSNAFVLPRPVNKAMLIQSVRIAMVTRDSVIRLKAANEELQQKMDDMKLIDRAKCVLIQYLRITESQAHRHIQKQAMDLRLPQVTVAKNILKTYESYEPLDS